jgi:uncharacterized protein YegL
MSNRFNTEAIKQNLKESGVDNTAFVQSNCCVCLSSVNDDIICVTGPCSHTMCITCVELIIESGQNCPMCRQLITSITTKQFGLETVDDFLDRLNPPPPPTSISSRMMTCGGGGSSSRIMTCGGGGGGSGSRNTRHMKLLPAHPVSVQPISTETSQFNMLHSIPSNGVGVVTMIASSEEIVNTNADLYFALDNSGSMSGTPLQKSKEAIIMVINNLKPDQRISLSTFDDSVQHIFPLQHVNPLNREQLISLVQSIRAEGGTIYTDSFRFAKQLFEQSRTTSERKRIMFFFSDGAPSESPDLRVIDELFTEFPSLILHAISMGNGVDASKQMVPLLRDRPFELGLYRDCSDMSQFAPILSSSVGDITAIWATNVSIQFIDATPNTSLALQNADGSYSVTIPLLNMNEAFNIAYSSAEGAVPIISYSFTKDGEISTGTSTADISGVLPVEISVHFPNSKRIKEQMNKIITDHSTNASQKQNFLRELLTQLSSEIHGIYFDELTQTINLTIQSLEVGNQHNTQLQNRRVAVEQQSQRGTSNASISRAVSIGIRGTSSQSPLMVPMPIPEVGNLGSPTTPPI